MSNTVDSNKSVDVMHADCLQQTFSTGVGMGLHFLQTHHGKLSSRGFLGLSLPRAEQTNSIPPPPPTAKHAEDNCVALCQI